MIGAEDCQSKAFQSAARLPEGLLTEGLRKDLIWPIVMIVIVKESRE